MDRKRIKDEILEILVAKLHRLPNPVDDPDFDFEGQRIRTVKGTKDDKNAIVHEGLTDNQLDVAEVAMDLEDAFGFNFEDALPGDEGLETVGKVIDHITAQIKGLAPSGVVRTDDE